MKTKIIPPPRIFELNTKLYHRSPPIHSKTNSNQTMAQLLDVFSMVLIEKMSKGHLSTLIFFPMSSISYFAIFYFGVSFHFFISFLNQHMFLFPHISRLIFTFILSPFFILIIIIIYFYICTHMHTHTHTLFCYIKKYGCVPSSTRISNFIIFYLNTLKMHQN